MSAAMPVKRAEQRAPAHYIRLTPSNQGQAFNSGAKQRVIKMMEMQKDPMEPPKFRLEKTYFACLFFLCVVVHLKLVRKC